MQCASGCMRRTESPHKLKTSQISYIFSASVCSLLRAARAESSGRARQETACERNSSSSSGGESEQSRNERKKMHCPCGCLSESADLIQMIPTLRD